MVSFSLCMIVKNEEKTLNRCIESTKDLFDEIIIVDTGSEDNTKNIAKKFTNKVYDFKWCDDFSKARNFSFEKATKDFIMWLDADDVILDEDLKKLYGLKKRLTNNIDVVMLKYNLNSDGSNCALTFYRERILNRSKNFTWISPIHEVIVPNGNVIYEDITITHKKMDFSHSKRNLKIFQKMLKNGQKLDSRQKFYYARELYYNNLFNKAIKEYNEFLNIKDAWSENKISACIDLYDIFMRKNNTNKALLYLYKTFEYDIPRSQVCCYIGNNFLRDSNYEIAKYWYLQAIKNKPNDKNGGFYINDFHEFIPCINLCVCYFNLGDIKNAKKYNDLAGSYKKNDSYYIYNKKLLSKYK